MNPADYPIQITQQNEDGGTFWLAECRELACKAHGDSATDAIELLREIISETLSDYEERGEKPPAPIQVNREYSGKLVLRISPLLHSQLAAEAEAFSISLNSRIMEILASRNNPQFSERDTDWWMANRSRGSKKMTTVAHLLSGNWKIENNPFLGDYTTLITSWSASISGFSKIRHDDFTASAHVALSTKILGITAKLPPFDSFQPGITE